ncbi:MAG TPA: tetratricopeptide repeat protein [Caulobacteraceae bacterium]|jgi:tetratricopeptide (TPR) repeat protein
MTDDTATAAAESPTMPRAGGRLAGQRRYYEEAVQRDPGSIEALQMLGVTCLQAGDYASAAEALERAVALDPGQAAAQANLAAALAGLGRHDAVVAACDAALALAPDLGPAHANRGLALLALGRAAEALASFEQALRTGPTPDLHFQRARALHALGQLPAAADGFEAALALNPGYFEALAALAETRARLGQLAAALACYDAAIGLRPQLGALHSARSAMLAGLFRFDEALEASETALALAPDEASAHVNRATALNGLNRIDEALAECGRALELAPDQVETETNHAVCLHQLDRLPEAMAHHDRAVALDPDFADARLNRAYTRLKLGDLPGGFEDYRARWRVPQLALAAPAVDCPEWSGEALAGRRLLVFCEQGFGDSLQFVRYLPRLTGQGAAVTVLTPLPLIRLFERSFPGVAFLEEPPEGARFDFQIAMMCLPRLLGTTAATIPGETPYLAADPAAAQAWRERLAGLAGPKVGLVWAGRRRDGVAAVLDQRRSLSLAQFAPLTAVAGVSFVSLQIGDAATQAASAPLPLLDVTAELGDFYDTAALVEALDLVIAVDTAVAHLAGGLGRPVWVLSRFDGCWRWFEGRDDSPWYPTLRLFRQIERQSWAPTIARLAEALAGWRDARAGG